ncbi:hypothetical protein LG632_04725, partial [Streptomyces sp. SMC 277]|nr:hypothetical protein [Streptomyces antimicrobicus]
MTGAAGGLGHMPLFTAALCAAAAAWLLAGGDRAAKRARLVLAGGAAVPSAGAPLRRERLSAAVRLRAARWREGVCPLAG